METDVTLETAVHHQSEFFPFVTRAMGIFCAKHQLFLGKWLHSYCSENRCGLLNQKCSCEISILDSVGVAQ